jgi:V/A-type H+-transporting ATPase subunit D
MIHPNRTYLLQVKQKQQAVAGSLKIIKARRQALLLEFLSAVRPFLSSRQQIRGLYYEALRELYRSMGDDGQKTVASIAMLGKREGKLAVEERNILGVGYYEVVVPEGIRRPVNARNYDISASSPHLEETADLLEQTVESLLILAAFETKIKRLGEEILRVSRRARVLEERILPDLAGRIKATEQYIGEREREEYFRLKKFKNIQEVGRSGR